jgi:citronellol/citronellal dehydrogenase
VAGTEQGASGPTSRCWTTTELRNLIISREFLGGLAMPDAVPASDREDFANRETTFRLDLLKNHVVLVSGGGGAIGGATAWLAARLGAHVVVTGRKAENLDAVCSAITAHGLSCTSRQVDIRDRDAVDGLFAEVFARHGRLDILVNSAGGQFPQAAIDFSAKGWQAVVTTNLDGTFHMMQAAARKWRDAEGGGSIVNVVVSTRGLHHVAHSCAARAGVIAFSEAVAVEWAPLGIRVNCVAPGAIRSEGWAVYAEHVRDRYRNTNPMRRAGSVWEVAEACVFLGGPAAGFITGETLQVTGGGHLWGEVWTTDKPRHFVEASRSFDPDLAGDAERD